MKYSETDVLTIRNKQAEDAKRLINIRKAQISDAGAICKISCHDLGYDCDEGLVKTKLQNLDDKREVVFVAENNGKVTGYVHAEIYNTLYCEPLINILGLAVSSDFHRNGAGKRLMKEVESWAQEKGIGAVRLNSGISRKGAHEFYRRIGYDNEKQQIRFMKEL